MDTGPRPPSPHIAAQHARLLESLPFEDEQDLEDAARGFIDRLDPAVIRAEDGRVVWDNDSFAFVTGDAPVSVNPSLWRISTLNVLQGLYEVVPGIYQVRGLDLAQITFVEGDEGVIVIDPLISAECAAAALALYRRNRGERPVTAVIYTHSHADHYGGVKGVTSQEDVDAGRCVVIAPAGLTGNLVTEWVYAGGAMSRRAGYMYAPVLERGPLGQVGAGLGQTNSTGTVTLINPTLEITRTGQEETVDGQRIVFQLAPGTEAPSEMHFFFPDRRALCVAENATHTLHNVLTLRGAQVRDPHAWAGYLTEMIDLFGGQAEVIFSPHHWPMWGNERILDFLGLQRDLYAYLHDQTLRLLNQGLTGTEIAEEIVLPPALERAWHTRGYYGSVSHNVKAIYQRYMGWYDGNPAHLWQHTPVEQGRRYVALAGGVEAAMEAVRAAHEEGDYRWAAELCSHVVFAEPEHEGARAQLADTLEQLGYGSENGTWRNVYLMGAHELRHGSVGTPVSGASADTMAQMTPAQVLDGLAFQIDGPRAWEEDLHLELVVTQDGAADQRFAVRLRNGVLTHREVSAPEDPAVTVTVPADGLVALAGGDLEAAGAEVSGDGGVLETLLGLIDPADPDFAIVTP
ncbi:alkyl sulfatase dimerization domain-containing protein [Janibacter alkaliphilus]|uniref:Linear primary-alkylsulfatase n=1 Tax=Janibacter alkaliphilus TaxID=1069963 RepID=A0A852X7Z1_9MICO|nr:alkyl sulfatase dimerization domain-containing protein [Janibacter alkaliphilus]NYG36394.1 alkyl sulfatase BDS1-like metallo-beta-lactamase superfamily hydrolase [Janibacter alkaliphilus]